MEQGQSMWGGLQGEGWKGRARPTETLLHEASLTFPLEAELQTAQHELGSIIAASAGEKKIQSMISSAQSSEVSRGVSSWDIDKAMCLVLKLTRDAAGLSFGLIFDKGTASMLQLNHSGWRVMTSRPWSRTMRVKSNLAGS